MSRLDPYLQIETSVEDREVRITPVVIEDLNIDVPPSDQMTMPGIRDILLQVTSVLKQHILSQRSIVSNVKAENKTRPTFNELTRMFTSSLTSVNASEFVHVEAVDRISQQFQAQVHSTLASAQNEVATMRQELSRVNDKFLEGFRRLDTSMSNCETKVKRGISHSRNLASKLFLAWRQRKLFGAWKEFNETSKLRKKLLKRFFTKLLLRKQREKFQKWKDVVTETRFRNLENETVKALNIGKLCCDKIEELHHSLDFLAASKAEVTDLEAVRRLASSKDHLKVIAEFREFVEFEIERVYKRVDGDRMKLKEQVTKCEQLLEQKAEDREVSELTLVCHKLDKDVQGALHRVFLQDEKLARITYTKKIEDLEFQVDMLHKKVAEAINSVGKMEEEKAYNESYAEALSTKSLLPSCLSCGGKAVASSPKVIAASGLLGTDKKFYKGDDAYNNLMMPGKRRLTLTEPISFSEAIDSPEKKTPTPFLKKLLQPSVIPAITSRMRTTSESPSMINRPARAATASESTRDAMRSRGGSHTRKTS
mmetsp:Transcript_13264/g.24871  ORF Transcript_13264/g.24871 Transcript_13264/m.24871 type:complete len:538 (+) Transcript_13264:3-1616(+)